ncbi:MAG: helix-turn-helix domain-containing protein [Mobilitalea sp.]
MSIGKNIKVFRINAGLKQKELADKLGKKVQYLSAIENDKREPSLSFLRQIAGALNVPASSLLWENIATTDEGNHVGTLQKLVMELASDLQNERRQKA